MSAPVNSAICVIYSATFEILRRKTISSISAGDVDLGKLRTQLQKEFEILKEFVSVLRVAPLLSAENHLCYAFVALQHNKMDDALFHFRQVQIEANLGFCNAIDFKGLILATKLSILSMMYTNQFYKNGADFEYIGKQASEIFNKLLNSTVVQTAIAEPGIVGNVFGTGCSKSSDRYQILSEVSAIRCFIYAFTNYVCPILNGKHEKVNLLPYIFEKSTATLPDYTKYHWKTVIDYYIFAGIGRTVIVLNVNDYSIHAILCFDSKVLSVTGNGITLLFTTTTTIEVWNFVTLTRWYKSSCDNSATSSDIVKYKHGDCYYSLSEPENPTVPEFIRLIKTNVKNEHDKIDIISDVHCFYLTTRSFLQTAGSIAYNISTVINVVNKAKELDGKQIVKDEDQWFNRESGNMIDFFENKAYALTVVTRNSKFYWNILAFDTQTNKYIGSSDNMTFSVVKAWWELLIKNGMIIVYNMHHIYIFDVVTLTRLYKVDIPDADVYSYLRVDANETSLFCFIEDTVHVWNIMTELRCHHLQSTNSNAVISVSKKIPSAILELTKNRVIDSSTPLTTKAVPVVMQGIEEKKCVLM